MNARLRRYALQKARLRRWTVLSVLLGLVGLTILLAPSHAEAATSERSIDIPGIDLCKPSPPYPAMPDSGLVGMLTERPGHPAEQFSIEHIYTSGGMAGLGSHSYDLGCAADPSTLDDRTSSGFNNTITNAFVSVSSAMTSLTDSVERRAWNPQWISTFLGGFADRATSIIGERVWVPLAALGLLVTTGLLVWRGRQGDISGVAGGVGWSLFVIVTVVLLLTVPTGASTGAQALGDTTVATLYNSNGNQAAEATTDGIVQSVQYQGYLQRTFGNSQSEAAQKYGPALLEASRFSWVEMDAIRSGRKDEEKEIERKRDAWKAVAEKVKDEYPTAYRYLQGDPKMISPVGPALMDVAFSAVLSVFRLMADLLMVTCFLLLTILALVFAALGFAIQTPWGAPLGREIANDAARAVGYALAAALAVWMFTIYAQAAMAPGMSAWWSLILLFLGSIVFWTMLRPDRKMLSMISMGRVDGTGAVVGAMKAFLLAHLIGKAVEREDDDEPEPVHPSQREDTIVTIISTDRPVAGALASGPVYAPDAIEAPPARPDALESGPETVVGEVVYTGTSEGLVRTSVPVLPSGEPAYQRGEPLPDGPTPPPPGSIGEEEIYQREETKQ